MDGGDAPGRGGTGRNLRAIPEPGFTPPVELAAVELAAVELVAVEPAIFPSDNFASSAPVGPGASGFKTTPPRGPSDDSSGKSSAVACSAGGSASWNFRRGSLRPSDGWAGDFSGGDGDETEADGGVPMDDGATAEGGTDSTVGTTTTVPH
ncbi:MAG TPA: hypothetical protein PLV92_19110 [Pirellulaceae bacterium]|nr:hypothetical protein [Pirellulaceae bacterium]